MNQEILNFINLITNNTIIRRIRDIPDDFEYRDELMARLHEYDQDGEDPPDELLEYALNNHSYPEELEKHLSKEFISFQISYPESKSKRDHLRTEFILEKVKGSQRDISDKITAYRSANDDRLLALLGLKYRYCELLANFLDERKCEVVKHSKTKSLSSYNWLEGEENLKHLYSLMHKKWITEDTTLDQFIEVFSDKQGIIPIKWHDDNASELLCFIYSFIEAGLIEGNFRRLDYKKLKHCFRNNYNSLFDKNFKELKQTVYDNISPEKRKAIEELKNEFL